MRKQDGGGKPGAMPKRTPRAHQAGPRPSRRLSSTAGGRRLSERDQGGSGSVVTNSGDYDATVVHLHDGQKIIETRDGSGNVTEQFIHGMQYIDELVMMRAIDKGDLYVHQGERSDREQHAIGKASRRLASGLRTCPDGVSTKRTTGVANWNVIALTDLGGSVVERSIYTPYGQLTVHQETSYGDRDGDQDVDATDKGTPGSTCTGTVSGACRILDLDFDGDYDSTDATKFDALDQGLARHPGRSATGVHQPFAHQGLLYEPELGQYQNRKRQYGPAKRRFVQRDPVGLYLTARIRYLDGLNPYAYVRGNSLVYRDPSGTQTQCRIGGCPEDDIACTHCDWRGPGFSLWCVPTLTERFPEPYNT